MAKNSNGFSRALISSIGWPLVFGAIATVAFYGLLLNDVIGGAFLKRYTAGHPVEIVEVAMFFIGLMFLINRVVNLISQLAISEKIVLPKTSAEPNTVDDANTMLHALQQLTTRQKNSYLAQRITAALEHVKRRESADHLDEEQKYLSDIDAMKAHDAYAFVRIIIWATPMLGFLGTVMGITLALGDLSPEALVEAPTQAMEGLLAGLSVAFDTTALALTLSIVLMFAQFLSNQIETQLLATVDRRSLELLSRRFAVEPDDSQPQLLIAQKMSNAMVEATEKLAVRQAQIWETSLKHSQEKWSEVIDSTRQSLRSGVGESLTSVASEHSKQLIQAEIDASKRAADYWQQVQLSITENAKALREQQELMAEQTALLRNVVDASQQVTTLEHSLNQNLSALAGAKNFEDTVMSLSAAVNLLTTRLGRPAQDGQRVVLSGSESKERAA